MEGSITHDGVQAAEIDLISLFSFQSNLSALPISLKKWNLLSVICHCSPCHKPHRMPLVCTERKHRSELIIHMFIRLAIQQAYSLYCACAHTRKDTVKKKISFKSAVSELLRNINSIDVHDLLTDIVTFFHYVI